MRKFHVQFPAEEGENAHGWGIRNQKARVKRIGFSEDTEPQAAESQVDV